MSELIELLHIGPLGVAAVLFGVSALYFRATREQPASRRILLSSHGVILAMQMTPVLARDIVPVVSGDWLGYALWGSLFLGIVVVANSLRAPGYRWRLHSAHIVTLFYGALANVYGYQATLT